MYAWHWFSLFIFIGLLLVYFSDFFQRGKCLVPSLWFFSSLKCWVFGFSSHKFTCNVVSLLHYK